MVGIRINEIKDGLVRLGGELRDVHNLPKLPVRPDWIVEV
jgi:hypothetical protein